jgi:hypothetical protein
MGDFVPIFVPMMDANTTDSRRIRRRAVAEPIQSPGAGRVLAYSPVVDGCDSCARDSGFLRQSERPDYERGSSTVRVVDLFCGCGGLTLGLEEAAHRLGLASEIPLAVDNDANALAVFGQNFPNATTEQTP